MRIVKQNDLYLIQDCCDALGSTYNTQQDVIIDSNGIRRRCVDIKLSGDNWGDAKFSMDIIKERVDKKLGTFGEISTYSFYPAHHMTTGQGGFIATDDYEVYKTLVSFRDWGRACTCRGKQDALKQNGRCDNRFNYWLPGVPDLIWDHKYSYLQIGFNLKPLELQAVIGLQQIKKLPQFEDIRKKNYTYITNIFWKLGIWKEKRLQRRWISIPQAQKNSTVNWFACPITILQEAPFSRQEFINYLQINGIQTRLYFGGNILYHKAYEEYVKKQYSGNYKQLIEIFPDADYVTRHTFFIGVSQVISIEGRRHIGKVIQQFVNQYYNLKDDTEFIKFNEE